MQRRVADVGAMEALGTQLIRQLGAARRIYLHGFLGAGKTTLVRGMLRGLGYHGAVKSPTFTLVEPYTFADLTLFHFDLYRLRDPEELEFLGIRDYLAGTNLCVVEWAERAAGFLPEPDLDATIDTVNTERRVQLTSHTAAGDALLEGLA